MYIHNRKLRRSKFEIGANSNKEAENSAKSAYQLGITQLQAKFHQEKIWAILDYRSARDIL